MPTTILMRTNLTQMTIIECSCTIPLNWCNHFDPNLTNWFRYVFKKTQEVLVDSLVKPLDILFTFQSFNFFTQMKNTGEGVIRTERLFCRYIDFAKVSCIVFPLKEIILKIAVVFCVGLYISIFTWPKRG